MAQKGKKADFDTGFGLLLNPKTKRGSPARLRSALADAEAQALPEDDAAPDPAETQALDGEWEGQGDEDAVDGHAALRPRSRANSTLLHVRLALGVHQRMTDFLAEHDLTMQEFLTRIVAREVARRPADEIRRVRVPGYNALNQQRAQAHLPRALHTALKKRALDYGMSLRALVTRLILFRVRRGRRPRPVEE